MHFEREVRLRKFRGDYLELRPSPRGVGLSLRIELQITITAKEVGSVSKQSAESRN